MRELEKVKYKHDEYKIAVNYGLSDQLKQLKEELQEVIEDMPISLSNGDFTANLDCRRAELCKKCELVEQTVLVADAQMKLNK